MFTVSKTEVERLLQMLKQQCPNSPKIRMDRNKFNDFVHKNFEMTDEMIVDRGKPFTLFEALRSGSWLENRPQVEYNKYCDLQVFLHCNQQNTVNKLLFARHSLMSGCYNKTALDKARS